MSKKDKEKQVKVRKKMREEKRIKRNRQLE